jgi:hypothetical protein
MVAGICGDQQLSWIGSAWKTRRKSTGGGSGAKLSLSADDQSAAQLSLKHKSEAVVIKPTRKIPPEIAIIGPATASQQRQPGDAPYVGPE